MFFSELAIGSDFFDPNSGEYFKKVNDNAAVFISGGDYFENEVVSFEPQDFVEKQV
jgi:hypothetical protein